MVAICKKCKKDIFKPNIIKRYIGNLEVYSFYKYQDISEFITSKYTIIGYRVYKELATITTKPFINKFIENIDKSIYIIGVDEHIDYGYSNVAILTHSMKTKLSTPLHSKLIAQNRVSYAGKSLEFRVNNSRNFKYIGKENIEAILVDDTITTGITLQEAYLVLQKHNVSVLFAVTLADAK
ncbi:Possible purine/pyrimidine phosphoribosyltransferase [hydrothermal vent metagenome]|uniref:Possible purine/pyrimidine phosphoribosyltransferase n=1 Tax=hydrothermal vent metagenome TaxID=652676 RepID=A0A1W1EHK7_9ZZZZ